MSHPAVSNIDGDGIPAGPPREPRHPDRLRALLAIMSHAVSIPGPAAPLRASLERALRETLPLRSVALREESASIPMPRVDGIETITFEVPAVPCAMRSALEATFDPNAGLENADLDTLDAGRHLAALALEIDRLRALLPGVALVPTIRHARREPRTPLIGSSVSMSALRERIERVAPSDCTILVEGESGSGKELVARLVHELSTRCRGPFVAVNCAALVETLLEAELFGIEDRTATGVRGRRGKFEHADGGTLFLDEVSDLSPSAQAKLLRAIQDLSVERVGGHGARRVDTRVVVATNRPLAELVEQGRFRHDLFYRVNGVELQVPPLRARREDIPELVRYFVARARPAHPVRFSRAALDALHTYEWPGNVRELEHAVERAIVLARSEEVGVEDLPPVVTRQYRGILEPAVSRDETMRAWGSRYARLVLARCVGNKREACRRLGISYHTLQAYLSYDPARRRRMLPNAIDRTVPTADDIGAGPAARLQLTT